MPSPSETDLQRRILDTTRHLLVRDGYASLSMRKIASEMGYSATSIYLHFESKDALIHTLIDEGMERLYQCLGEAERRSKDVAIRMTEICRAYVRFGLQNAEYYQIMFMLHPEEMARFPAELYRRARRNLDVIQRTLAGGLQCGAFAMDDARVSANAVWTALHGLVSLLVTERVDVRIDRSVLVETAVRQIVAGVSGGEGARASGARVDHDVSYME